jgi:hypothetical protein
MAVVRRVLAAEALLYSRSIPSVPTGSLRQSHPKSQMKSPAKRLSEAYGECAVLQSALPGVSMGMFSE